MGHLDDGLSDGRVLGSGGEALHERLVDLHRVERQLPHVANRRVAGAEVVDGQAHAEVTHPAQLPAHVLHILDEGGLGDLEAELSGVRTGRLQHPGDGGCEVGLRQLAG